MEEKAHSSITIAGTVVALVIKLYYFTIRSQEMQYRVSRKTPLFGKSQKNAKK
jgi:hypothetical protein